MHWASPRVVLPAHTRARRVRVPWVPAALRLLTKDLVARRLLAAQQALALCFALLVPAAGSGGRGTSPLSPLHHLPPDLFDKIGDSLYVRVRRAEDSGTPPRPLGGPRLAAGRPRPSPSVKDTPAATPERQPTETRSAAELMQSFWSTASAAPDPEPLGAAAHPTAQAGHTDTEFARCQRGFISARLKCQEQVVVLSGARACGDSELCTKSVNQIKKRQRWRWWPGKTQKALLCVATVPRRAIESR